MPTVGLRSCDTLIRHVLLVDGSGAVPRECDVTLSGERIAGIAAGGTLPIECAHEVVDGAGLALAPGFIDVHAHDDTQVIRAPEMTAKVSQGVTTVVVGNCGISAAPVRLAGEPPDPLNLLGGAEAFAYPSFAAYVAAVNRAQPAVNVAALVGHTALRASHLQRLDRAARPREIEAMRGQVKEALAHGALGLSTGLAYRNASAAPPEEVAALMEPVAEAGGLYCSHLRTEFAGIREAMEEAFGVGRQASVPVNISHLKCAGVENHGRGGEILAALELAGSHQTVGADCYPYTASSSTLDLAQVTGDFDIRITWSDRFPGMGGRLLAEIASEWGTDPRDAARRLQPAGAVYHNMAAADVERILCHPLLAIGSDGLPDDPRPHPRLFGAFPRVLGYYSRERGLFPLAEAVRKMTGLSADRFSLVSRGYLRPGYQADLVLFDPATIRDAATFAEPTLLAEGIAAVWVNGTLTWQGQKPTGRRAGRFLPRTDVRGGEAGGEGL
jgi:N-acyl-D-amino-acid deacylase